MIPKPKKATRIRLFSFWTSPENQHRLEPTIAPGSSNPCQIVLKLRYTCAGTKNSADGLDLVSVLRWRHPEWYSRHEGFGVYSAVTRRKAVGSSSGCADAKSYSQESGASQAGPTVRPSGAPLRSHPAHRPDLQ